jgi:hypothetical protein
MTKKEWDKMVEAAQIAGAVVGPIVDSVSDDGASVKQRHRVDGGLAWMLRSNDRVVTLSVSKPGSTDEWDEMCAHCSDSDRALITDLMLSRLNLSETAPDELDRAVHIVQSARKYAGPWQYERKVSATSRVYERYTRFSGDGTARFAACTSLQSGDGYTGNIVEPGDGYVHTSVTGFASIDEAKAMVDAVLRSRGVTLIDAFDAPAEG